MLKLLFAAALAFSAPDQDTKSLSPAEQAQLRVNLDRGLKLYRYDQSAWHVTDAMMAALSSDAKSHLRGYVTTPAEGGLRTTFFGESDGRYFEVYSATWTGSEIVDAELVSPEERRPVTEEQRRLIEARKLALKNAAGLGMCSNASPNAIVVPGDSPTEPISVYILTPQTEAHVYPLGGHHRLDVKDGKVIAKRAFTNGCIDFDKAAVPDKGRPEAAVITHLLDTVPTEIHVFSVFAMGLPLFVGIRDGRVYVVEINQGRPSARVVGNAGGAASK